MEHFRQCLNKLVATPPRRKAALVRSILPGIEAALRSGHCLKEIWLALEGEGLQMKLPRFSQDLLTQQKRKEANRRQLLEKTG
jgi:hypothetical protein